MVVAAESLREETLGAFGPLLLQEEQAITVQDRRRATIFKGLVHFGTNAAAEFELLPLPTLKGTTRREPRTIPWHDIQGDDPMFIIV